MRSGPSLSAPPVVLLLLAALTAPVAAGPWQVLTKPVHFNDVLALGDTAWCATTEAGVLRYVRSTDTFTRYLREAKGVASYRATALALDGRERLWVGTGDAGVNRLERDRLTWGVLNQYDGLPSPQVLALRAYGDTVWIGTAAGLALWNGREIAGRFPDGVNESPFLSDTIVGVVQLGDSLWAATNQGVYKSHLSAQLTDWTPVNEGFEPQPGKPPFLHAMVWDGVTLMVTEDTTPLVFDFPSGTWQIRAVWFHGVPENVFDLTDHHGVIVASTSAGIFRWDKYDRQWAAMDTSGATSSGIPANGNAIFASTVDEAGSWVAAGAPGVYWGNGSDAPSVAIPAAPPSNDVINLGLDGEYVYVGTNSGAGRYDGREWRIWKQTPCGACDTTMVSPTYSYAFLRDRQGKKWIGTWDSAMEIFDDFADPPSFYHCWLGTPPPNKHTWAWASALDSSGGHWFGMDTPNINDPAKEPLGLDYYDASGAYRRNYSSRVTVGFRYNKVHSLTVDRDSAIWLGYSPGGLQWFRPPRATATDTSLDISLQPASAVPSTYYVEGLAARGDDIWALTDKGLLRLNRLHPEIMRAEYDLPGAVNKVGLRPLDVGPDGTAWAGSEGGVRACHPDGSTEDFSTANSPLPDNSVRAIYVDPRTGVVWFGTGLGVASYDPHYVPSPSERPTMDVRVYPNPAMLASGGLTLHLAKRTDAAPGGIYRGAIYDLAGRRVRSFQVDLGGASPQVFWDGRDTSGRLVRSGVYFVRLESGGRACTVRVALVR